MKFKNQVLTLYSAALPADTLMVAKLVGDERMSGLFRFELDLICQNAELDLEAVLYAPVKLSIKVSVTDTRGRVGSATREIAGVFESFEQHEQGQGWAKYHAVLMPKMWQAKRAHRSRIFMDKTIDELVTAVLEKDGLDPELDMEFKLSRAGDAAPDERPIYPSREYVVQYEESDWQFLARWLEHEGIFFYFVNEGSEENEVGCEKVIFGDTESAYAASMFGSTYPYRPEAGGEGGDSDKFTEEEVRSFHCRQTRLPKQVTVNDYNWRVPSARLHFSEDVLENGTGLQTEYNDHFRDEKQGQALAKIRKEELSCRAKVFSGTGSCRAFRPGTTFTLDGHFRDDFNRAYLLVAVRHEAEQMISLESATITGVKYENSFEAITDDQPWRPERVSDWPAIKGVMHAKVDAEGDGKYADLDPDGRYKLKMPFDEHSHDAEPGKASRWVRMAQPYAGANAGMHFPLLKGTEVLLTHIDGDPDRPVISGAVPNPETESPAAGGSHTRNAIRTASGNTLQIDDDDDAPGFLFEDATASYVDDRRRHYGQGQGRARSGSAPSSGTGGADSGKSLPQGTTPSSGRGMTQEDTRKEAGWNTGAFGFWTRFTSNTVDVPTDSGCSTVTRNTAFYEIANQGKYQTDTSSGQRLSSWDGPIQGGVPAPTTGSDTDKAEDGSFPMSQSSLASVLAYMTKVSTNLSTSTGSRDFGNVSAADVSGIFSQIHNFTGEAYGSRLRTFVGDDLMIKVGDKYTYNDVTRDVSIGTGGYGWKEEHGDTDDHSWHWGNATSYSKHVGNSMSTSFREGTWNSHSYTYGAYGAFSLQFDAHGTFSLTGSIHTSNSVDLGIYNSNSLFIGAKGGFSLTLGGQLDINIMLSAKLTINMGAVIEDEIDLCPTFDMGISDTKIALSKKKAALNSTAAALMKGDNAVSRMSNTINNNNLALTATQTAMKNDLAALSAGVTSLAQQTMVVAGDDTRVMNNITAAMTKMTSAVTML